MRIKAAVGVGAMLAGMLWMAAGQAQMRAGELGDDLLTYVDFDYATQQAAQSCKRRYPEWIEPMQKAHREWRELHGKAQKEELALRISQLPARPTGDPDPVRLLQADLRAQFTNAIAQMDPQDLLKFCREYAQQFANPAMNFTERLLRAQTEAAEFNRKKP
jgi:hypothetical protein